MRCIFPHIVFSIVSFAPLSALSALVDSDGDQAMSEASQNAGQSLMRRERAQEVSQMGVQTQGPTEEMTAAGISPHAFFTQSHGFTEVHQDAAASGSAHPRGAAAKAAAAAVDAAAAEDKKEKGDDETPPNLHGDSGDKKPEKHMTHIKAQHMVQNSKSTLKTAVTDALESGESEVSDFVAGGEEIASEFMHKMKDGSAADSAHEVHASVDAFSKEALEHAETEDAAANKAQTHVYTEEEAKLVKEVEDMHLVDSDMEPDRVYKAHGKDSFEMRVNGPTGELCLGNREKDKVQAWSCDGHKAQQWFWSEGNTKHLMNLKSDKQCLGYIGEKQEVNNGLLMYSCQADDESPLMTWIVDKGGRLVTESTGECMALPEPENLGQYSVVTLPCEEGA